MRYLHDESFSNRKKNFKNQIHDYKYQLRNEEMREGEAWGHFPLYRDIFNSLARWFLIKLMGKLKDTSFFYCTRYIYWSWKLRMGTIKELKGIHFWILGDVFEFLRFDVIFQLLLDSELEMCGARFLKAYVNRKPAKGIRHFLLLSCTKLKNKPILTHFFR